jgi:hypothetical protein
VTKGNKGSERNTGGAHRPRTVKAGYGRPPLEHRFSRRQSGNPRGRPKGKKNEATILQELLNRKITIREDGKPRKITVLEAILLRFTEDALKGNTKTAAFLFNRYESQAPNATDDSSLTEEDREILNSFVRRFEANLGEKS